MPLRLSTSWDDPAAHILQTGPSNGLGKTHHAGALRGEALSGRQCESRVVPIDKPVVEPGFEPLEQIVGTEVAVHGDQQVGKNDAGEIGVCLDSLILKLNAVDPQPPEGIVHARRSGTRQLEWVSQLSTSAPCFWKRRMFQSPH